jgi:hypothetical protein
MDLCTRATRLSCAHGKPSRLGTSAKVRCAVSREQRSFLVAKLLFEHACGKMVVRVAGLVVDTAVLCCQMSLSLASPGLLSREQGKQFLAFWGICGSGPLHRSSFGSERQAGEE